jgi:hypothetical protein
VVLIRPRVQKSKTPTPAKGRKNFFYYFLTASLAEIRYTFDYLHDGIPLFD